MLPLDEQIDDDGESIGFAEPQVHNRAFSRGDGTWGARFIAGAARGDRMPAIAKGPSHTLAKGGVVVAKEELHGVSVGAAEGACG